MVLEEQQAAGMGSVRAVRLLSSPTSLTTLITGSPYNPLVFIGPKIDYTFFLRINYNQQTGVQTYVMTGVHDGFPAYQLDLNGVTVWDYDPIDHGETPLSLIGSGEWDILGNTVAGVVP